MKVLTVSNLYPPDIEGGYELGCFQMVGALRQRGHEVTVLTAASRVPASGSEGVVRGLRLADVFDPELSRPRSAESRARQSVAAMWIDAANVSALLAQLERTAPDVVYLWNLIGIGGMGLVLALEQLRMPWVWHLMDPVPAILTAPRGPWVRPLQRYFERQVRGRYIACSKHVLEEAERNGLRIQGDVELIPNWVTGPRPAPAGRRDPGRPLRIMMASVVTRFKGVDLMMEAAALLRRRGVTNFTVDVFGRVLDGSLVGQVDALGLNGCLSLRGEISQDELQREYAGHDLLAFPTWEREAFGFAAVEAAFCGCVPLVTARAGCAEWLVDGVHCLKAERSPEAFADAIEAVVDGRVDLGPIAARGRRVMASDFHVDTVSGRVERVLAAAAADRSGPGRSPADVHRTAVLAENLASAIIDDVVAT